jgi:hypothetical protein
MAKPSDLLGEVAAISQADREGTLPAPPLGVVHTNLNDARSKRQQARRAEALSLRLAGLSYEQIGERLQISTSGAEEMINRTLERAENRAVTELRELENARLDRAQDGVWSKVLEGDLKAVDVFLRISNRRSKLNGLDAPTQVNLSVHIREELNSALTQLEAMVLTQTALRANTVDDPAYAGTDD